MPKSPESASPSSAGAPRQNLDHEFRFISAVLETAGALVIVVDREGRIVLFNRACETLSGYSSEEAEGRVPWEFLLPPDEIDGVMAVFSDLKAGRFPNEYENDWITRAGERRRMVWKNTALQRPDGEVEYIIGTGIDITDRRRLEEELRQAQKMEAIGRLAGGLAHDFNNVLLTVTGRSERLLARLDPGDPVRREIEEIAKASGRATSLTRQLLNFTRRELFEPREVQLNDLIEDVADMIHRLIGEDIDLETRLDPALGWIRVDPTQMEQIILNLAVNARDAMPQGGKLVLETASVEKSATGPGPGPSGLRVRLSVHDTGVGMDEATRVRAFEPFFTTKEAGKGTGLGLSTVYAITRQSGGDIQIESAPGKGTRIVIDLPVVEAPRETAAQPAEAAPEIPAATGHLLLVEDDAAARELLKEFLEEDGFRVTAAGDGNEALGIFEADPDAIDLVITDRMMPGMGGLELADRVLELRPAMRVLCISGYPEEAAQSERLRSKGIQLLQKPFSVAYLSRTVRTILAERSLQGD